MTIELTTYTPDLAQDLADFYNGQILGVPHCHATDKNNWKDLLLPLVEPTKTSPLRFHRRLKAQQFLIAREAGRIVGFVHSVIKRARKKTGADRGTIAFLAYERGQRLAGQTLLTAAEDFFHSHDIQTVYAFPGSQRYPFYHLDSAALSERLDHVQALLAYNGYRLNNGVIFLERPDLRPSPPPMSPAYGDIQLDWSEHKGDLPNLRLEAVKDGTSLGICDCISFVYFGSLSPVREWFIVKWLGVEKEMLGQRLGLYLLERSLAEMQEVGYRHAAIGTGYDNHLAYLFYTNHGFRAVDWTYEFIRDIQ